MSRKLRVLVFEDDAIIRHIIERMLKYRDYEVFSYNNPLFKT
jgi:CheY-like chemotaxis protein